MKPQVSIIVPVYNIKDYIEKCLDSIMAQDFSSYEVIIIDDGSTDGSSEICDRYKSKYDNIRVYHQKNSGLSEVRNHGIEYAKADYISFVDGDDLVSPNFLSRMYQIIQDNKADIVVCGFKEFYDEPLSMDSKESEIKTLNREEAVIRLLTEQENYDIVAWNKLYKKELFKDITYPKGMLHEDTLTTYKVLAAAKHIATTEEVLYYYRKRRGSIMDEQDLVKRLAIKEQAAREAMDYFAGQKDLELAAEISVLLSELALLDGVASGKIKDDSIWYEKIADIRSKANKYKKNKFIKKKQKLYLSLIKKPIMYKTFRKIIN